MFRQKHPRPGEQIESVDARIVGTVSAAADKFAHDPQQSIDLIGIQRAAAKIERACHERNDFDFEEFNLPVMLFRRRHNRRR